MKAWVNRAIELLDKSLGSVPQELNELDWKQDLSPNNAKLCKHISAFANNPNGGFMVFGVNDKKAKPIGIERDEVQKIIEKLASLCRDGVTPLVSIDHEMVKYQGYMLLFIHFKESDTKPVHLVKKSIEDSFIRSGGSTKKAFKTRCCELSTQ